MSILQIFAHIHELTVQRKDISRRKVKNSSANIVELQKKKKKENVQHVLKDDHRWL